MFDSLIDRGFQVEIHSHAKAILSVDFPDAVADIETAIGGLSIPIQEIIGGGGGETQGTQRLRRALADLGWRKLNFTVEKRINGVAREAISHEIDHVKTFDAGVVALEIEWNNKDPFFDRDLENFKRLHADGAISVGMIVTRGRSMQDEMKAMVLRFARERGIASNDDLRAIGLVPTPRQQRGVETRMRASGVDFAEAWSALFVADKYGAATTHWSKLEDRVHRGVGNPCPLVLIGLPSSIVTFGEKLDMDDIAAAEEKLEAEGITSAA
ncbi:hypothetical protein GCM10011390_18790 [Aureimonas endophytica]|uniref:Restriction endonuclease BglII n=1 Tax=Aureimonas endophytica TaxID=2027858 RepID=A0A917E3S0_9HYPH|nr:BglII/BstYI family type II restriction endonuclease [Aureimonas endophytica]GGE00224.1 hypothetical protein GCM10011390_18790 [Aureimonas endophytica]